VNDDPNNRAKTLAVSGSCLLVYALCGAAVLTHRDVVTAGISLLTCVVTSLFLRRWMAGRA